MRYVLLTFISLCLALCADCSTGPGRQTFPVDLKIRRVTSGPSHHFASAYYHLRTWDKTGRYLLCLETEIENHNPEEGERATLGMVDLKTGVFVPLAVTRAWNFQQGAMQQWLGSTGSDSHVIYNDFREGRFAAVVLDAHTKKEVKIIPRALSALSHDGTKGVSINFARLHITRPGYGYAGPGDKARMEEKHPADDGLYAVDLETGESRLMVSLDDIYRLNPPPPGESTGLFWINHTMFNEDDTRVFFLGRTRRSDGRGWLTASYTVGIDGSGLRCVLPYTWGGSHFDWLSGEKLMVTCFYEGKKMSHVLFTDGGKDFQVLGAGVLTGDGHGTFSPDGRWMVTDTYPGRLSRRTLLLFNMQNDAVMPLGRFYDPPDNYNGPARCDLHPRWNSTGDKICFDAVHEGTRQVYIAEMEF